MLFRSNHCHLIIQRNDGGRLSDLIRDLKRHTSKKIVQAIEDNGRESRRKWLLFLLKKDDGVWFWRAGYHGIEIKSARSLANIIRYIHRNPVKAGIVVNESDYSYSSAADFAGISRGPVPLADFF